MVKQITRLIALLIITCSQANAYQIGDVLYCSSETGAFVRNDETKPTLWNTQRFKFSIARDKSGNTIMRFGEDKHFGGDIKRINFLTSDLLEANDLMSHFALDDGTFHYAYAFYSGAGFMKGTCDKF